MTDLYMRKAGGALFPVEDECEAFTRIKPGDVVLVKIIKPRNIQFHRKLFSLLNFAFEHWEPVGMKFRGVPVGKDKDVFRGWIICKAGFYDLAVTPDGRVKASPKSISFAQMDESEFSELYSKCIDVILQSVLKNYSREDLEQVLEQIVGYI